jgi:hypothetical protein
VHFQKSSLSGGLKVEIIRFAHAFVVTFIISNLILREKFYFRLIPKEVRSTPENGGINMGWKYINVYI